MRLLTALVALVVITCCFHVWTNYILKQKKQYNLRWEVVIDTPKKDTIVYFLNSNYDLEVSIDSNTYTLLRKDLNIPYTDKKLVSSTYPITILTLNNGK